LLTMESNFNIASLTRVNKNNFNLSKESENE